MEHFNELVETMKALVDKYGFWSVVLAIILMISAWQSPQIIAALK